MAKLLRKQEAQIVLYNKLYDDDFYYLIKITNKSGGGCYYKQWMDFKEEIDELGITQSDHDWICEDEEYKDREELKIELEKRGFHVRLGNILEDFENGY